VLLLENRALCPCEQLAYRTELHALAEEEDIDERNKDMDAYRATLEGVCDVLINDDLIGSSTDDVTVGSMAAGLYGAGPRLQLELSVLEQLVQATPRPAFGIVGGTQLHENMRENMRVLNLLIDVLDEIMLG
jgi:3-phosphoglycerate kinase